MGVEIIWFLSAGIPLLNHKKKSSLSCRQMDVGWIFQCFVRESLPNAAILTSLLTSLYTLTSSHLSSHLSYNLTSLNVTNKKSPRFQLISPRMMIWGSSASGQVGLLAKSWTQGARMSNISQMSCASAPPLHSPAATSSSEFHVTSFNYVLSMKPWILHLFGKTAWKHVFWFQFKETDCIIFSWEGCFWEVGKIMWEM